MRGGDEREFLMLTWPPFPVPYFLSLSSFFKFLNPVVLLSISFLWASTRVSNSLHLVISGEEVFDFNKSISNLGIYVLNKCVTMAAWTRWWFPIIFSLKSLSTRNS